MPYWLQSYDLSILLKLFILHIFSWKEESELHIEHAEVTGNLG